MTRVQRDEAFREQNIAEARRIITGMVRCPVPVIAAVNGPAVGLGCSLALLSDLVLWRRGPTWPTRMSRWGWSHDVR